MVWCGFLAVNNRIWLADYLTIAPMFIASNAYNCPDLKAMTIILYVPVAPFDRFFTNWWANAELCDAPK